MQFDDLFKREEHSDVLQRVMRDKIINGAQEIIDLVTERDIDGDDLILVYADIIQIRDMLTIME
jgi:hypothetical protein